MTVNDRGGKAALLTELLGAKRLEEMRQSGALPRATRSESDAASLVRHRNRLIEKFRERGLIETSEPAERQKPQTAKKAGREAAKPKTHPDFAPGGIGTRLAKHLNPERLADEHPAVIAMFLRSQPANLRSEVLRGLPGSQARAVMRILRAGRPKAETPAQSPKAEQVKEQPKPEPEVEVEPTVATVAAANDVPKMPRKRRSAR